MIAKDVSQSNQNFRKWIQSRKRLELNSKGQQIEEYKENKD